MTSTRATRTTFLGWHQPFPTAVAGHLVARWPEMDFGAVSLVVSGGRVKRRIISLLADLAQARQLAMLPPRILTVGELHEELYPRCAMAGNFLRQVAWVAALKRGNADLVARLFPRLHAGSDATSWQGAAGVLDRCKDELAAGRVRFDDVHEKATTHGALGNAERWEAARDLHLEYLGILRSMGFADRQQARLEAMERGAIAAPAALILAGVVELSPQVKAMLAAAGEQVESLIYAPADLAGGFDDFGCVRPDYWCARPIDLAGANLRVAQRISDQAETVFAELAGMGPDVRTDDITIGVADESIVPHLETTAANLENIAVRYGAGIALSRTRPFQLLKAVADYLQSGEFRHFAVLVRHPDVERYLRTENASDAGQGDADESAIGWRDWRTLLDRYACEYLPLRLGPECRQATGWRGEPPADSPAKDERIYLAWLYAQIDALVGELRREDDAAAATAAEWATPILALLRRVYGRLWELNDDRQRLIVMACQALRDGLDELRDAGDVRDRSYFQPMSAHEAIRSLANLCASEKLAPPQKGDEIEMVGWLELMPDDAAHLVITGFNEGLIPESSRTDPLLNETVREAMGMMCDRDRLARDAYLLTAIVQSRPPGAVTLICGRQSAQDDPLLPSRLMFACDSRTMAKRVLETIEIPPKQPPLELRFARGEKSGFRIGAAVPAGLSPLASMRVTAFRDYLASPQGFYLRHILKLETLENSAPRELDPRQYGTLIHQVLNDFGTTPAAASNSRQQCEDTLHELLAAQVAATFGASLPGALRFQVEMIRRRLAMLADRQARWFAEGWRIVKREWDSKAPFAVDNADMEIRGRIDRIDFNERLNTFAVLDYKVTNGEKTPEKTHQTSDGWCDLQLPLYRHLARAVIADKPVMFGYVVLSDREDCTGHKIAGWDEDALNDADATAQQVVRDVRDGKFQDVGDNPPTDGIFANIFGEGVLITDTGEEAGEELP